MIDRFPPELLKPLQDKFTGGNEGKLYLQLGFYLQIFATAEVYLTSILVTILGFRDFEKLEFITRGMDARIKCERFRQAAKKYNPLGDNLKISLGIFEQECIPLRNSIAHSWAHFNPDTNIIHFASFGKTPSENEKGDMKISSWNPPNPYR